jgi:hypothetical protein
MNSFLSASLAVILVAAVRPSPSQALSKAPEPAPQAAALTAAESPFYCDVGALTPEQRKRHFNVLGPALIAKRSAVRELPDGYEIQLPSDVETYQQLAEYVDGERACCPFFDISIQVAPERGPLLVRFTGRPGTKQFIEADGAGWIAPVAKK